MTGQTKNDDHVAELLATSISVADSHQNVDNLIRQVSIGSRIFEIVYQALRKSGCELQEDAQGENQGSLMSDFKRRLTIAVMVGFTHLLTDRHAQEKARQEKSDDYIAELLAAAIADADLGLNEDAQKRRDCMGERIADIVYYALRKSGCGLQGQARHTSKNVDVFKDGIVRAVAFGFCHLLTDRDEDAAMWSGDLN